MTNKIGKIEISNDRAYVLEWKTPEVDINDCTPVLVELTFYDKDKKDDVVFPIHKVDAHFKVDSTGKPSEYSVTFSATMEIDLPEVTWKQLEKVDNSVDYVLEFEGSNGKRLNSSEGFEFIHNYNVLLQLGD